MIENHAEVRRAEVSSPLFSVRWPFLEKIGAGMINLAGAGVTFDSFGRVAEGFTANSVNGFVAGVGELVLGAIIFTGADIWKKRVWRTEDSVGNR